MGITEVPTAWARGPPLLWDPRGPHRMGEGASFALGSLRARHMGKGASFAWVPLRPPPHG